ELLSRNGSTDEAIKLLQDGVAKVPVEFSRHKLIESILFTAYTARRQDTMQSLLHGAIVDPQKALGLTLLRLLAGDWEGAVSEARKGEIHRPTYWAICAQEGFSLLCAGRPEDAQVVFERFPLEIHCGKGNPNTWLACLIAIKRNDNDTARKLFDIYIGQSTKNDFIPSTEDLLHLWNTPVPLSTPHPGYYYSTLPPSITGLPYSISRPPSLEPISFECINGSNCDINEKEKPLSGGNLRISNTTTGTDLSAEHLSILVIATEWFSRRGGLSTLNRQLCTALAMVGHRVVCVVPSPGKKEIEEAEKAAVCLIAAPPSPGADEMSGLYRRLNLPNDFLPDIVIGHGRITGPAAKSQVDDFFPTAYRIHFVHMAPGQIEWLKGKDDAAIKAEERELIELELAKRATLVAAVGPRLAEEVGNLLCAVADAPPLHQFNPGVISCEYHEPPIANHCLVLGRAEDFELKGLDIVARAFARLAPKAHLFEYRPTLFVRGAPAGTGTALRKEMLQVAKWSALEIRVREYSSSTEILEQDVRRACLVLMPSRSEGFGLVALEALNAGTPFLATQESGFAELLKNHCGAKLHNFIVETTGVIEKD